jgi:hypothetical protein
MAKLTIAQPRGGVEVKTSLNAGAKEVFERLKL